MAEKPKSLSAKGGDYTSEPGKLSNNDKIALRPKRSAGTDLEYLTARIARDSPEVHEAMKRGEYPSVRAAAIADD